MLWASPDGSLEIRKRASQALALHARFPYASLATLHSGGNGARPRKEQFAPRAFSYVVDGEGRDRDVHLLVGHSFDKPLASRSAGTLQLRDTDEALLIDAQIGQEMQEVSYVRDFLAGLAVGLVGGISPGFRIPPPEAVPEAERIEEEDPAEGNALIRTILAAILFEVSIVTRPAYPDTQVEARNWTPSDAGLLVASDGLSRTLNRWRV